MEEDSYDVDAYPLGRSLEQVMEHCESILDDSNYGRPIEEFDEQLRKLILSPAKIAITPSPQPSWAGGGR